MHHDAVLLRWIGLVFLLVSTFAPLGAAPAAAEDGPAPPGDTILNTAATPEAEIIPPAPETPAPTLTPTTVPDQDGDTIPDADDNCVAIANSDQTDADADGTGDACAPTPDPEPTMPSTVVPEPDPSTEATPTPTVEPTGEAMTTTASARTSSITAQQAAPLDIDISPDSRYVIVGDQIGFTVTVTNSGSETRTGGFAMRVETSYLPGANWTMEWSGSPSDCQASGSAFVEVNCSRAGDVAPGETFTLRLTTPTTTANCNAAVSTSVYRNGMLDEPAQFVYVLCGPNLELSVNAPSVAAGTDLTATVRVSNAGTDLAPGVAVEVALPTGSGFSWTSGANNPNCQSLSSGRFACDIGTVGAGSSRVLQFTSPTSAEMCGTDHPITATLTATGAGSASGTATVTCEPDVNSDLSLETHEVTVGDEIRYTVTVSNTGSAPGSTGLGISMEHQNGFRWSISLDDLAEQFCSVSLDADRVSARCDGELDPGESYVVTITSPTTRDHCGEVEAPFFSDNVTVVCEPGIEIAKTVDPASGRIGDTVTYTFEVINSGDLPLTSVTVTDPLLGRAIDDCARDTLPVTGGNSYTCTATYTLAVDDVVDGQIATNATVSAFNGNTEVTDTDSAAVAIISVAMPVAPDVERATCADGTVTTPTVSPATTTGLTYTLDPGGPYVAGDSVTVTATLDQGYGWPLKMPAGWTIVNGSPAQATYTVTLAVPDCPTLTLEKSASPAQGPVHEGDEVVYRFTVTNTGNVALDGVTVADPLLNAAGVAIPEIGSLEPGEARTVDAAPYTVTLDDVIAGSIDNTATATSLFDGQPVTSSEAGTTLPTAYSPAIKLTKTSTVAADAVVEERDTVHYTLVATNTGNAPLTGVTITDPLKGLSTLDCDRATPATLAPGDALTCTAAYTVTLADVQAGEIANTATATGFHDGNAVSGEDSETFYPVYTPNIAITKTADVPAGELAHEGDTVTYTFVVENTGNLALDGVTLDDPLPGLVWDDADALDIGTLEPGEDHAVTLTATYVATLADARAGEIGNTATVTGNHDGESLTATSDVTVPVSNDPAVTVTVSCPDIPGGARVGDEIAFEVTVTNTGDVTLTDVEVSAGRDGILDEPFPARLAPGERATRTFTSSITSDDAENGSVDATFAVTTGNGVEATDDTSCAFTPVIELSLDLTQNGPIDAGDLARLTIKVSNTGDKAMHEVKVLTGLPDGVEWALEGNEPVAIKAFRQTDSALDVQDCAITGGTLACAFDRLKPGESVEIVATAQTDPRSCEDLVSTVIVATGEETIERPFTIVVACGTVEIATVICTADTPRDVAFRIAAPVGSTSGDDVEGCTPHGKVEFTIAGGQLTAPITGVTNEDGLASIGLAPGEYTITDVASQAHAGFSVVVDGTTRITVASFELSPAPPATQEPVVTTLPSTGSGPTGDGGATWLMAMLASVAACGAAASAARHRLA